MKWQFRAPLSGQNLKSPFSFWICASISNFWSYSRWTWSWARRLFFPMPYSLSDHSTWSPSHSAREGLATSDLIKQTNVNDHDHQCIIYQIYLNLDLLMNASQVQMKVLTCTNKRALIAWCSMTYDQTGGNSFRSAPKKTHKKLVHSKNLPAPTDPATHFECRTAQAKKWATHGQGVNVIRVSICWCNKDTSLSLEMLIGNIICLLSLLTSSRTILNPSLNWVA